MTEPRSLPPAIALVHSPDPWVDDVHRYCTDHGGARVRCVVLDPVIALDEEFDVLVVGERWTALTRELADALHGRGRRIVVVRCHPPAPDSEVLLYADRVLDAGSSAVDIVGAVAGVAERADAGSPPFAAMAQLDASTASESHSAATARRFVVVGGPFGAGSTEVAIALAAASARRHARVALVDADDTTPSLATRLGLPAEPNVCTAVAAAAFGAVAVPGALFDLGDGWPAVLVGPPRSSAAVGVRGADVAAVGTVLTDRFDPVVLDVSGALPRPGADPPWVAALVGGARAVVAVGAAHPVGVVRLLEWVRALGAETPGVAVHVVVNRAPGGRRRRAEVAGLLQRELRLASVTFTPGDGRVEDAAWSASLVERGPFTRSIDMLLGRVLEARDPGVHVVEEA